MKIDSTIYLHIKGTVLGRQAIIMEDEKIIARIYGILKKCISLIFSYNRFFIFITIIIAILQGIIPALSMITMQTIINMLQVGSSSTKTFIFFIGLYTFLDMLSALLTALYGFYYTKFSANFDRQIKTLLLHKAASLSLRDFENSETYNIINRAQNQGGDNILSFFNSFISIIRTFIAILSSAAILSRFNIKLIAIILIIPLFKYIYSLKIGKIQYDIQVKRTDKERNIWYINYLFMTGTAFKEIRLYGLKEYLIKKYNALKETIIEQDISIARRSTIVQTTLSFGDQIVSGSIFYYLVYCGIKKLILIGDVITYTKCIFSIKRDLETILSLFSSIAKSSLFIGLLFKFIDLAVDEDKNIEGAVKINGINKIQLDNVSYKYKGSKDYALKNISLTIDKNQTLAVVGKNGSGKSTLIKIILGFYDDYEGNIFINGMDFKKIDKKEYQKYVGCIFQDYMKYEASLRENVSFGSIADIHKDDKIIDMLNFIQLNKKIYKDEGLETIIGSWFGDKQISIGEWQKVAIARGLIRNAELYVLDEPDSSLDAEAEFKLLNAYKRVFKGRLGIFVSHKVSHVSQITDRIVVLDKGCVTEEGDHEKLMKEQGVYYKLFSIQKGYSLYCANSRNIIERDNYGESISG